MFKPEGVQTLLRASGAQLRSLLIQKGAKIQVTAMGGDRITVATPPLMTKNLALGDVDLTDLGMWFHYRPAAQQSRVLGQALDAFISSTRNGLAVRTAARVVLESVCPTGVLQGATSDNNYLPIVLAMYMPAYEGFRVDVTQRSIATTIDGVTLRMDQRHMAGFALSRHIRAEINPLDTLTSTFGWTVSTTPSMGAVYQHLLRYLPEWSRAITAVVSAAAHGGMQDLLVDSMDVNFVHHYSRQSGVWADAMTLVDHARAMPYLELRELLKPLIGGRRFAKIFGSTTHWLGRQYTGSMREKHRSALIAMRTELSEVPAELESDLASQSAAEELLHQQFQVR